MASLLLRQLLGLTVLRTGGTRSAHHSGQLDTHTPGTRTHLGTPQRSDELPTLSTLRASLRSQPLWAVACWQTRRLTTHKSAARALKAPIAYTSSMKPYSSHRGTRNEPGKRGARDRFCGCCDCSAVRVLLPESVTHTHTHTHTPLQYGACSINFVHTEPAVWSCHIVSKVPTPMWAQASWPANHLVSPRHLTLQLRSGCGITRSLTAGFVRVATGRARLMCHSTGPARSAPARPG